MKKIFFSVFLFLLSFVFFSKNVLAISDTPDSSFPQIQDVYAIAYDHTNDILYIGGNFTNYNGEAARDYLIALNGSDGSLINTFNPVINGAVISMYLSGSTLYIGGTFTTVSGTTRNHLAAINANDGSVTSFNTNVNGSVYTMVLSGTTLYIGGSFNSVAGIAQANLAAINTTNGSLITTFDPVFSNSLGGMTVAKLYLDGTNLYVGSDFAQVNGVDINGLTGFDISANTDNRITTLALPAAGSMIYDLDMSGNILYFSGIFSSVNGVARTGVAATNVTTGVLESFNPVLSPASAASGVLTVIKVQGNEIYIGGGFTSINSIARNYLASVDRSTGSTTSSFNPNLGVLTGIHLFYFNNYLYTTGDFTTPRQYSMRFQDTSPGVTLSKTTASVTEGGATDTYTIVLDSQPTADVIVSISPDTQSSVSPTSLTFTSVNWATPQTITITAVDDDIDESATHFSTISHSTSSADANYNAVSVSNMTVTITDNDTAGITQSKTTASVTEGGATDTYTIVLDSQPTADVIVSISPDTQSSVSPTSLTFTSVNWATPQTITITAVDDSNDENDTHSSIITHSVASTDGNYDSYSLTNITVTVTDNDTSGGGGLPAEAYKFPDKPLLISINNNDQCTNSKKVKLKLTTGGRTKYVAISEDQNFTNASLILYSDDPDFGYILEEPHVEYKDYILSNGYGKKIIYLKYYTAYGRSSDVVFDSIIYTDNLSTCQQQEQNLKLKNNTLFKYSNSSKVYLLENNKKRWILSEEAFISRGYKWSDIKVIDDKIIYPNGKNIGVLKVLGKKIIRQKKVNKQAYHFTRFLNIGSSGEEVRQLQTRLKELGYYTYQYITGYFGPITSQAVKAFQKAQGIISVGYVGPQTRRVLNK